MSSPSEERETRETETLRFVAGLGAAMASANYPVTMVREAMVRVSRAYGLDNQYPDKGLGAARAQWCGHAHR